jgi:hypothetical protein
VRVLLDENLPHDLINALVGHSVLTVQGLGWEGTKNGVLQKRASGLIDAFVTIDGNLQYQQNVSILPFGIVVVGARRIACRISRRAFRKCLQRSAGFSRARLSTSVASEAVATT